MEEILSDIGSTPSLEPVTDDNILDLFNSAPSPAHPSVTPQPAGEEEGDDDQDPPHHQQDVGGPPYLPTAAPREGDKLPSAKLHACGFCGAVLPSHRELVEHRASHGGSRPYECHMCDKRFTQKAHLIIHRRTHTGEKPYSCHICHKRFSQSSHLNSHKRVHTGEKPFFCSICSMGFCRKQRLEAHLQQHAKDVQHTFPGLNADLLMSAQNSLQQQQQQQQALNSEAAAKDFLMSIGLGSVMVEEEGGGGESRAEEDGSASSSSSVPKAEQQPPHMAVFPGFSMESEEEEVDNHRDASAENDHADGLSGSPTPSSSLSQRSPTPTSSKSRRKPAFVRKLGFGQAGEREEGKEDSAADKIHEPGSATRADLSAHAAAAVRAMMCMATGADYSNTDDLTNEILAMDTTNNTNTNSVPRTLPQQQDRRNSLKAFPSEHPPPPPPHAKTLPPTATRNPLLPSPLSSLIRTNSRVSLVDFTADDLLRHLMSRDDVYRCDFCRVIFHDAAMYHLHRSMHDKMDIRCCNLCGKLLVDKYDFTAHFLSQHK